jgi:PAS domain S-box-containing protein
MELELAFPPAAREGHDGTARRRRLIRRLTAQIASSQVLANSETQVHAWRHLLRLLGRSLDCVYAVLWQVDDADDVLHPTSEWRARELRAPEFVAHVRKLRIPLGRGLPGRVWASGKPIWVADMSTDDECILAAVAATEGLHSALAVPVMLDGRVIAVIEMVSQRIEALDSDVLETVCTLGRQIGQYLRHVRGVEALRASDARIRSVLDHSLSALVAVDRRGTIELVNPAAEKIFGYSAGELIGRTVRDLFPPEDRRSAMSNLCAIYEQSRGRVTEWRGFRKNGETFSCEVSIFEFPTTAGQRFAASIRDLTEIQGMERMKKELVSIVSHELRTPLTSIRGSLTLLANGVMGEIPAEALGLVRVAERNCTRLISLINDMLDLERIDNGLVELDLEAVDTSTVVGRAFDAVRGLASAEGISLSADIASEVVWADDQRLTQVLVNLLSNAIKFSPRGSRVLVSAHTGKGGDEIQVSDSGRGIPPSHLEAIFERFGQVESTDSREKGGTGLGLAICKAIVQLHGGTIGVISREGEGSTFSILLPRPAELAAPPPPAPPYPLFNAFLATAITIPDNVLEAL